MNYPPTYITRHLKLCERCRQYRAVLPGCKMPPGTVGGRRRFVCVECVKPK